MTNNSSALSSTRHPELVSGSISRLARNQRWQTKPHRQVPPLRVLGVDEVDLPLPMPSLELLLAHDRPLHVAEHLEMDEAVDFVARGEAGEHSLAMLDKPLEQVRGDTDVDGTVVPAREDVDARVSLFPHASERAEKWTLKQVQGDEIYSNFEVLRHAELVCASTAALPASIVPEARNQ
jgi:hypothetical protein